MSNYRIARENLAILIGVNPKILTYILYRVKIENSYIVFEIKKKRGGLRTIYAPNNKLKNIQRKLGKQLCIMHSDYVIKNKIKSNISHGFVKEKSIITNAHIHTNKKYLLNIDISNFFESFNFGRVQGYFQKSKEFSFTKEVATVIAQLTCYDGKLPQGAPTSPIIANLIFNIVDLQILSLAKKYKLNYTRYADDMSFSTNNKKFKKDYLNFIKELSDLLVNSGFKINNDKTRLMYFSSKQEVTGLTVNRKINVNRSFINDTRAMANSLYKRNEFYIKGEIGTLEQLEGRFSYINHVNSENYRLKNKKKENNRSNHISELSKNERQYQYFLFYKYFYRPKKITIVTEGKTDILHIKAALMKHWERYPNLITKNANGKYEFNIYFLNKTDRLNYFFNISPTGADSLVNIWNAYTGKKGFKNVFKYINEKRIVSFKENINPVILLFDNEQKSEKPLKKFKNITKVKVDDIDANTSIKIIENLYLQTIPLMKGMDESEIEDLYYNEDSKQFSSKIDFANYILKNYNKIDFKNFLPFLDSISKLVKTIN